MSAQSRWMWVFLVCGVLMVMCSQWLGRALVQTCDAQGNCQWSPDDAANMALPIRCLGFMAFAAGLTERVVMAMPGREED